jgi:hypothetical protein
VEVTLPPLYIGSRGASPLVIGIYRNGEENVRYETGSFVC